MVIANEPSAAPRWLSRVPAFIRANREPSSAPTTTSAALHIQGGRPPSTHPVPWSTPDPIIAPNIQLAGKWISRRHPRDGRGRGGQLDQFERSDAAAPPEQ